MSDYGAAVGQPIIRGMSGSRVKILDNGIVNRDVSGLGADHFNDIDLSNAQQIEVVRGPSSLLYTNGAIGISGPSTFIMQLSIPRPAIADSRCSMVPIL